MAEAKSRKDCINAYVCHGLRPVRQSGMTEFYNNMRLGVLGPGERVVGDYEDVDDEDEFDEVIIDDQGE